MRSLRGRLLAGSALGTTAVMLAAGLALYALARLGMLREFDGALETKARILAAGSTWNGRSLEVENETGVEWFEVWMPDGKVGARSASLKGADLPRPEGAETGRTVTLPGGGPGRMTVLVFRPHPPEEDEGRAARFDLPLLTLAVAGSTAGMDATLARLRLLLVGVWAAAVAVSALTLAWITRRSLRCVDALAGQVGAIGEGDLGRRVTLPGAPSELEPPIRRLNELLSRLEAAFAREKGFTADAAHELRTPLAGLRTTLEVALMSPREAPAYRKSLADSLEICRQLQSLVEALLSLARLEAGDAALSREPVRPGELLRRLWEPLAARAGERRLRIDWDLGADAPIGTDREKLGIVLANLLANAADHAEEGGWVRIASTREGSEAVVDISNSGSRLSPAEAEKVFDRFWRGDRARAAGGGHYGLGLAICKRVTALLGGSIRASSRADGVFRVRLALPA